jgi:acyl-CoA synthetase (AMP-forming)/AMP-acid ligase II
MVGEPMTAAELTKWQGHDITLHSLYGISENAKGGMFGPPNKSYCDIHKFGRPFCATPWIVSPHHPNIPMRIGAQGDMLPEGPCVSKGYVDNEEQDRMTFLEDPAWSRRTQHDGHGRFSRTGDLLILENWLCEL